MKILLVNPEQHDTFFSYKHALKLALKKPALPPLGLLTVASLLPGEWPKKMVDLNVEKLKDSDLEWSDMVFISAMIIQKQSAVKVIAQCNRKKVPVVAGGPLFTHLYKEIQGVDHFVLGEAEEVLGDFMADLECGGAKSIYRAETHPSLALTAVRIFWRLGVLESGRFAFWRFLFKAGAVNPVKLVSALSFAAVGYHFKKCTLEFVGSGPGA